MSNYDLHPQASADLLGIHAFIAKSSLDSADKTLQNILAKFDQLAQMPQIGHTRSDLADRSMRFVNVYEYLIAYVPDRNPIRILAVVHGRSSTLGISAMLQERH